MSPEFKLISEIIEEASALKTKQEKINFLRNNYSPSLAEVLKFMYDPTVSYFTNEVPKYTIDDSPVGYSMNNLYSEAKRLYIFKVESSIDPARKKVILTQMLENVHRKDAILLEKIIGGKKADYKINKTIVQEAFPGLIP